MAELESKAAVLKDAARQSKSEGARWPLSFRIPPIQQQPQQGLAACGVTSKDDKPKKRWWSHQLYRGPNDEQVKVQYSKTKTESEVLAKQFLNEKVVGFDMEWPWNEWKQPNTLQNKIGLIQVATEDRVALFHIGLHTGKTTDDIIAPSLRKLIETDSIGKIGVGILNADFARLHKYFKLQPKGAVELSHLHRLVTFGGWKPELVSTKMTSLAYQVEKHLGHPLYKGDVRTSHWSKPLSQEQIKYAAGDAYAGFMLYHCLNAKRLRMKPVPPMPIHAEKYLGFKMDGVGSLYLEPAEEGGKVMTSAVFFGVPTATDLMTSKAGTTMKIVKPKTPTKQDMQASAREVTGTVSSLDSTSLALYQALCAWRTAMTAEGACRIGDVILTRIAEQQPLTDEALLGVKGVGKVFQQAHGKATVAVVSSFMGKKDKESVADATKDVKTVSDAVAAAPSTPKRNPRRKQRSRTPDSSPAFSTLPRRTVLHTGLSFTRADASLGGDDVDTRLEDSDTFPPLDFGTESRRTSGQKRKRPISTPMLPKQPHPQDIHPDIAPPIPAPLTPRTRILHSKLTALSKLVARRRGRKAEEFVSASLLEGLAQCPPRSREELGRVQGVEGFVEACGEGGVDLWGRFVVWA